MPSSREEEPRRRKKEYDRDSSSRISTKSQDKERDKDRHRSHKKSAHRRRSSTTRETRASREGSPSPLESSSSVSDLHAMAPGKKVTMLVPEMERRSSIGTHTSSYPSFSKDHSREAVHSRDNVHKSNVNGQGASPPKTHSARDDVRSESPTAGAASAAAPPTRPPPSPPLTEEEVSAKRAEAGSKEKRTTEKLKADSRRTHKSSDSLRPSSAHRNRPSPDDSEASDMGERRHADKDTRHRSHRSSKDDLSRSQPSHRSSHRSSKSSHRTSVVTDMTEDSEATSKPSQSPRTPSSSQQTYDQKLYPPQSVPLYNPGGREAQAASAPPNTVPYSSPRTATAPSSGSHSNMVPHPVIYPSHTVVATGAPPTPGSMNQPPTPGDMGPPPPPPPVFVPEVAPRVDYLLRNGGLPNLIPKTFMPLVRPQPVQSYSTYQSPRMDQGTTPNEYVQIFSPFHAKLDNIQKVLANHGSLAVATGYRAIARRLLDRLEYVFSRPLNTENERCCCVMCKMRPRQDEITDEEQVGYNWGEILEFVCGRKELPDWPPFSIDPRPGGLGIDVAGEPMQNVDPDVPAEWHDHYRRQNAKTKKSVMGWLQKSETGGTVPPSDIDDDTLMFAITTRVEPERRPILVALRKGLSEIPSNGSNPPTPCQNDVIPKVALALERLYRLEKRPRDSECCIYLLNNPGLHDVLFTLASVNEPEWHILISGRFDGFLWSGAEVPEDYPHTSYGNMSRGTTPFDRNGTPYSVNGGVPLPRNNTPFSPTRNTMTPDPCMFPSRGTTPGLGMGVPATPAPIAYDEDTEMAILADMEREIFRGMEELEDQFERLHAQSQVVQNRLRERAAGLAIAAKTRQGGLYSEPRVRGDTPSNGMAKGWNVSTIWSPDLGDGGSIFDDGRSELVPDDSASNIGFDKRPPRKAVRRTPAPVLEEDEEYYDGGGGGARKKSTSSHHRR